MAMDNPLRRCFNAPLLFRILGQGFSGGTSKLMAPIKAWDIMAVNHFL